MKIFRINLLKQKIPFLLKCLLTGILFYVIFSIIDINKVVDNLHKFSFQSIFIFFILCTLSLTMQGIRWYQMVKHVLPGSCMHHLYHYWAAFLFNIISPAAIGGDLYRIAIYRKVTEQGAALPTGLVVQERFINLLGYCFCYLFCFFWAMTKINQNHFPIVFKELGFLFGLGFVGLLFMPSILNISLKLFSRLLSEKTLLKIDIFANALQYQHAKKLIGLFFITLIALIIWIVALLMLSTVIIKPNMPTESLGLVAILAEFSRLLPFTIQGVGLREGVAAFGFEQFGFNSEAGFLIFAVAYIINSVVLLFLGLLGMLGLYFSKRSSNHSG